jgi:putative phosphoesterase
MENNLIGLISDTHNQQHNLQKAIEILRKEGASLIFHCGDLTDPELVAYFEDLRVIHVTGNADYASGEIQRALLIQNPASFSGQWFSGEIEGKPIAAIHGNDTQALATLIQSGKYAYVFHGHTHARRDEWLNTTHVINPGALGGVRRETRSFALLDLVTGNNRFVFLEDD